MKGKTREGAIWEGIPAMMKNKEIRESSLRRVYPCGKQTVFVGGEEIPFAKFDKMFPLRLIYKEPKGQNVCRKTDFIYQ